MSQVLSLWRTASSLPTVSWSLSANLASVRMRAADSPGSRRRSAEKMPRRCSVMAGSAFLAAFVLVYTAVVVGQNSVQQLYLTVLVPSSTSPLLLF